MGGPLNEFEIINDPLNGVSKQHDVRRLDDGNILIFDNGNGHSPPTSRVVEYSIDEENKIAELVWEYTSPYNYLSLSMGSSQRLPNQNTLINWGFFFETIIMDIGALITEVDYNKSSSEISDISSEIDESELSQISTKKRKLNDNKATALNSFKKSWTKS